MATKLNNLKQFLLNDYIETINEFVGKEIVKEVGPRQANKVDDETFNFFEELTKKIREVNTYNNCYRKCPFRTQKHKLIKKSA